MRSWVSADLGLLGWPEPALFLALFPFAVLQFAAIDAHAGIHDRRPLERRNVRDLQLRMFASSLLPLVIYIGLATLIGLSETVRVHVERVALWNAVFLAVLLVLVAGVLPLLVRNTWETVRMPDGVQRTLLERVAQRASFRAREVLVWRTGNLMANAAIVGVWPGTRVVLFSDSLLSVMSLRELAGVYGHEIGHAVRHHVAIFIAWALGFFLAADLVANEWIEASAWISVSVAVAILGLWAISFGWLSRRFELEADLYSAELLGDPGALVAALERLGGRLRDVAGWRHFSTSDRVAFLDRATHDAAFGARFKRRLRVLALAGFLFAGSMLTLQLVRLAESYSEDVVYAQLALGRFEPAARRAELTQGLDDGLFALTRLAEEWTRARPQADEPPGPGELGEAALDALADGDLDRGLSFVELAVLRGDLSLVPVLEAIDAIEADDPAAASGYLRDVEGLWAERLDPWLTSGPESGL